MPTTSLDTGELRIVPENVFNELFDLSNDTSTTRWGEIEFVREYASEEAVPGYPLMKVTARVEFIPHPRDAISRIIDLCEIEDRVTVELIAEQEVWVVTYEHLQTVESFNIMGETSEGRQQIVYDIVYEIGRRVINEMSKTLVSGTYRSGETPDTDSV